MRARGGCSGKGNQTMHHGRMLVRLLLLVGGTALGTLLWQSGRAVLPTGWQGRWRGAVLQTWARAVLRLLGIRVRVQGTRPRPPFFLVANHLSYLDMLVLAAQGECVFIAKREIAAWPAIGWLSRQMGTLFIDRTRKRDLLRVNAQLAELLAAGQNVVLFPEGTTTPGETVLPFKSGLLDPVVRAGRSVTAAGLHYHTGDAARPAATALCWWGEMEFVPHFLAVLRLAGGTAALVYHQTPLAADDRKTLARALHAAVARALLQAQALATGATSPTVPVPVNLSETALSPGQPSSLKSI